MTYRGHMKNGVVVADGPIPLPDGTPVEIQPVDSSTPRNVWQKLSEFAGRAEGLPADAAENLDHYLYGTKKR